MKLLLVRGRSPARSVWLDGDWVGIGPEAQQHRVLSLPQLEALGNLESELASAKIGSLL